MFIDALAWLNKFGYRNDTRFLRRVAANFELPTRRTSRPTKSTLNYNIDEAVFNQGRKKSLGGIDERGFRFIRKFLPTMSGDIVLSPQMRKFRFFLTSDIDGGEQTIRQIL